MENKQEKGFLVKRHSIHRQIAGFISFCIAVVIFLVWLMNNLFLEGFYVNYKVSSLRRVFSAINAAQERGVLYEDSFSPQIERLCANENLSLIVISADGTVLITSSNEKSVMMDQLYDLMLDRKAAEAKSLYSSDAYTIQKHSDERTNNDYLSLWGTLADSNIILLRSAMQSIADSARLSNRLLVFIGLFSLVIGIVLSSALARHMTKPIYEMTQLSKRMTELDFEAKYLPRKRMNELDILGAHLNELSDALKNTILDLKQANNELQRDIHIRDENEKMRREFISNVSHELKTPLALIRGYAEGIKEGVCLDEENRDEYLDIIIDESEKMSGMVQKLLSLNRLEYGTGQIHMDRVELSSIVAGVCAAHRLLIEQNGINLSYPQNEKIFIWTDPALCEQVIDNYLSNAIHYCLGEKRIDIRFLPKDGRIRLSVFNTGEPIDENAILHVWDKFYKADEARTREYGGSGIGLSIVHAIAEGLNTDCGVENLKDGVEFWFEFDC